MTITPRSSNREILLHILRKVEHMQADLDRLTASVARVATDVGSVADEIRNHPAAADDGGSLSALADKLDGVAGTLESLGTSAPGAQPAPDPATPPPAA